MPPLGNDSSRSGTNYEANAGFEEIAAFKCPTVGGCGGRTVIQAIPEPASIALLGLGLLGVSLVRRRPV